MKPIYLDYNATTPILPEVAEAMKPCLLDYFGNPSSSHWYGIQTRKAVETARESVAGLLSCKPGEIIFTSGGSESNNMAIKGIAYKCKNKGNHIITSSIEHPAVIEVCKFLESQEFKVTYLPVDAYGIVNPEELEKAITNQTTLITIMHANNEVGSIQPIKEISKIAVKNKIVFHTDAAQSVGKIPTNVKDMGIDLLSVAGHKFYAPKGIGALYIKEGIELEKMIHGANHENNKRAGTENILEIVGLGEASNLAKNKFNKNFQHMKEMRDRLENGLMEIFKRITVNGKAVFRINGHSERRLPNTLSISFLGIEANKLLLKVEDSIAASAGAACHSDGISISTTLKAMGIPEEYAMGTVRLSTGKLTTVHEIEKAIDIISTAVKNFIKEL